MKLYFDFTSFWKTKFQMNSEKTISVTEELISVLVDKAFSGQCREEKTIHSK